MPEKELFNQTLKSELALTDRIAVGIPGQLGADNLLVSSVIRQTGLTLIKRFIGVSTRQVFQIPVNSNLLRIDFKSTGTSTIKVTQTIDGDLVSEIEFTGNLKNSFDLDFETATNLTIDISGDPLTVVIMYIFNYY